MDILTEYKIFSFEKKIFNWCVENKTVLYADYDDYFRDETVKNCIEIYDVDAERILYDELQENYFDAISEEKGILWEKCKEDLNIPCDLEEHLEEYFYDFVKVTPDYDHYFGNDYHFTIYLKTDKNTLEKLANLQGYTFNRTEMDYLRKELEDFINDANEQHDIDGEEKLYDNEQDFYKKNKENIICIPVTMSLGKFFDWQLGMDVIGICKGSFIGFFDEYCMSDFKCKTERPFYLPNDMIARIEINKEYDGLRGCIDLEKFKNIASN